MTAPHDAPRTDERAGLSEEERLDRLAAVLADRLAAAVARAEAAEAKVAAVEALASEWWGRATEATAPPSWRAVTRDLRASTLTVPKAATTGTDRPTCRAAPGALSTDPPPEGPT